MLITRTPLRISIGGGGTDLPSYYRQGGSIVVSAAINKYVYIGVNSTFVPDYFIKYSALERAERIDDIRHPLVREALRTTGIEPGVEIVSMADIPAGTGLGSSGTFTVGLLRALYAYKRTHITAGALAEEACRIEIDVLNQPVGKQDQYIAAFGGLTCFEFHPDERVTVTPLAISNDTLHDLEEHLLLFFTGYSRTASSILQDQKQRSIAGEASMRTSLEYIHRLGLQIREALEAGKTGEFADLMHEHWEYKRQRSAGMSNGEIDRWYDLARWEGPGRQAGRCWCRRVPAVLRRGSAAPAGGDEPGGPRRGPVLLRPRRLDGHRPGLTVQCVILAGGLATRMRPLTDTVPKALLPVAGRPFAHWQLSWLAAQGVADVVYCIAHLGGQIRAFVGDGSAWGLGVAYAEDGPRLRGTAGAIADTARSGLLDESFLVLYGDSYLDVAVETVWRAFGAAAQPMLMTVLRNDDAFDRSNVRYREGMVELYEKGVADTRGAGMHHIDYGLSALRRDPLLGEVPADGRRHDLAELAHRWSRRGRVAGFEVGERFYEIGSPGGLADLERHLSDAGAAATVSGSGGDPGRG